MTQAVFYTCIVCFMGILLFVSDFLFDTNLPPGLKATPDLGNKAGKVSAVLFP